MRLSVATNFDPALVDALRGYPVVELFGKLREDAVGGGRAPYQLAPVSRSLLAAHVRHARAAGISFNYLLNASCLGNREVTRAGQAEIEELCGWLCGIGVETVTVSSPFLLRIVKTRRWCHDFAAKAVRVDPEASRRALAAYDELFRSLDGGAMWRYLPDGSGRGGS
jgi:hypothetical protein